MRAVIFDVAGVLSGWQPDLVYRKLVPDDDLREHFLTEVCRAPWDDRPVRGGAYEEGLRRLAERWPKRAELFAEHHERMLRDLLRDRMAPMATLMARLSEQDVTLFGVTDLPEPVLSQVRQLYPSTLDRLREVAERPISAEVLVRWGLDRKDCLYVDRSEAHTRWAEAAGIDAHLYTWVTPLRRELRARGFLPIPSVLLP